jgi:hypothetical protein
LDDWVATWSGQTTEVSEVLVGVVWGSNLDFDNIGSVGETVFSGDPTVNSGVISDVGIFFNEKSENREFVTVDRSSSVTKTTVNFFVVANSVALSESFFAVNGMLGIGEVTVKLWASEFFVSNFLGETEGDGVGAGRVDVVDGDIVVMLLEVLLGEVAGFDQGVWANGFDYVAGHDVDWRLSRVFGWFTVTHLPWLGFVSP